MRVVTYSPHNAEASSAAELFVRSHFAAPEMAAEQWRLRLGGGIAGAPDITLASLRALPRREYAAVMECAGNGRTLFRPLPKGTPWGEGAVSCATFGGASLADALRGARIPEETVELVFAGADAGDVDGKPGTHYERSLPLDVAMRPDTILCHEMNGAPLARDHGAPVRLVVPGWYGVASVKWLAEVRATREPFEGYYQKRDYVFKPRTGDITPVQRLRVKSMITDPAEGRTLHTGSAVSIRGLAWSGEAPISRVDVSSDGGQTWAEARLEKADSPYAWRAWSLEWVPRKGGDALLCARAKDEAGREQPWVPEWNQLGYGWNAIPVRRVHVLT